MVFYFEFIDIHVVSLAEYLIGVVKYLMGFLLFVYIMFDFELFIFM